MRVSHTCKESYNRGERPPLLHKSCTAATPARKAASRVSPNDQTSDKKRLDGRRPQRRNRLPHVGDPLVAGLAFDGERAGVMHGVQGVEDPLRADLAGAEGDLLAPLLAGLGGRRGV